MKTYCKECSLPTKNQDALCDRCREIEQKKKNKKKSNESCTNRTIFTK
jgi:hypothetical protein